MRFNTQMGGKNKIKLFREAILIQIMSYESIIYFLNYNQERQQPQHGLVIYCNNHGSYLEKSNSISHDWGQISADALG